MSTRRVASILHWMSSSTRWHRMSTPLARYHICSRGGPDKRLANALNAGARRGYSSAGVRRIKGRPIALVLLAALSVACSKTVVEVPQVETPECREWQIQYDSFQDIYRLAQNGGSSPEDLSRLQTEFDKNWPRPTGCPFPDQ